MCWHTPICMCLYSDVLLCFQLLFHCNYHKLMHVVVTVYGHKQTSTYTHTHAQCSLTSVGLTPIGSHCMLGRCQNLLKTGPSSRLRPSPFFEWSYCARKCVPIHAVILQLCALKKHCCEAVGLTICYHYTSKYLTIELLQNHCMRTSTSQLVHHCGANLGCWINVCHGT